MILANINTLIVVALIISQLITTTYEVVSSHFDKTKRSAPEELLLLLNTISSPFQECVFLYITGTNLSKSTLGVLENKISSNVIISNPSCLIVNNSSFYYLQRSGSCSIVIYLTPLLEQEQRHYDINWIVRIPGTLFFTLHVYFEENTPENYWSRSSIRRLYNAVVLVKDFSFGNFTGNWNVVVPNRFGENSSSKILGQLFQMNTTMITKIVENEWWDFKGDPLRIASPLVPVDKQLRVKQYREKGIFSFQAVIMSETAQILNATPVVVPVNIEKGMGNLSNGTWDSYIGKIMDESVHMTLPFTPFGHQFNVMLFSKGVVSSPLIFFAPIATKQEVNFEFLTKPLDSLTWLAIVLSILANAIVIYALSTFTPSQSKQLKSKNWNVIQHIQFITSEIGSLLRVLNDQPMPENMLKQNRMSDGVRIVVLFWLIAMIAVVHLYKSVVISIYVKPPLTFSELLKSDFQVNFLLYEAFNFEERFPNLKKLKLPVKDHVLDFHECLKTLIEGNNVCFFVFDYLNLYASEVLLDAFGRALFLISKDAFYFTSSSFGISQKNPKLKRNLDRIVDVFIEGSLESHWVAIEFYQKSLKTIRRKQQEKQQTVSRGLADKKLMQYPLLLLLAGIMIALVLLFVEVIFYHCHRKFRTVTINTKFKQFAARAAKQIQISSQAKKEITTI